MDIEIKKIARGEALPFDLLYLADPSAEAVDDYTSRGECYAAYSGGEVVGEYVLVPTRPSTVELVNVAVDEKLHGQGIGRQLVEHAISTARQLGYVKIEVGTGAPGATQLMLYQKCGFRMEWIDRDFFVRHCPEPFSENGVECRDMVRMGMYL